MVWQTLFNSAVLSSGMNPEVLSKLDNSILEFAKAFARTSSSRSEAWLALAGSELLSGVVAAASDKLPQAEQHLFSCLNALDRYGALTTVSPEVSQIRLSALAGLTDIKVQQKAWGELLAILKSVEQLAIELKSRTGTASLSDPLLYAVHANRALAYSNLGRKDEGLASLELALAVTERHLGEVSDELDWAFAGWRAHVDMAEVLVGTKDSQQGLRHRKRAAELARNALVRDPGRSDWEDRYWDSLHELGDVLNDAGDASAAYVAAQESLAVAQRNAKGSAADSDWSRNVFLSLWELATIDIRRGDKQIVLKHSEAAARLARDRHALNPSVQFVLIDRWLIENRLGIIRSSLGDGLSALQAHQVALSVAQKALHAEPDSDEWIENSTRSHARLASIFSDRRDWMSALRHSQAAAALAGRKSATSDASFEVVHDHWLHQFNVGRMHLQLKAHIEARAALTQARDLVLHHWHRFSGEDLWRESRWLNEQEFGLLEESEENLGRAEAAYARATAFAEESQTGSGDVLRVWRYRLVESLTSLVRVQAVQGKADALRQSTLLLARYRDLDAADHENNRRNEAKKTISLVLADIGLSPEQAQTVPKADLLDRLQHLIDATRETTRVKGLTGEDSQRMLRLQNALFAVRQLPD
ncbi:hypothetical protein ACVC7V_18255 [Hydrogenophaga sp. A37]|uniref:hypothetical protein n=1 Tax=Hydrogenophaga sp. A37 TaxID=1945864 RepID=UPI0009854921|nr:hypothetical protein [Hydrogenophaga sp. A37]OOG86374.1 hypothetical protein B0E41_06325 [Hydrogenophaga sp. A37]